jgi:predicted dehydrogenase
MLCFRHACELIRAGGLGKLHTIKVTLPCRWTSESNGPFPPAPLPPGLDWDRWLGQAPVVDYCPRRCHGSFRRWYEYSGGQMTDWGAHQMDIAHWAQGDVVAPLTAAGTAEFPNVTGGYNTPIQFNAELTYTNDVRVQVRAEPEYDNTGVRFEGDRGWLFVNRGRLEGSGLDLPAPKIEPLHCRSAARTNALSYHLIQFLIAMKTGEPPVSDVASQHRAATACHLTNIAMRLGRKIAWDAAAEQIADDAEANAMLSRSQRQPYQMPPV